MQKPAELLRRLSTAPKVAPPTPTKVAIPSKTPPTKTAAPVAKPPAAKAVSPARPVEQPLVDKYLRYQPPPGGHFIYLGETSEVFRPLETPRAPPQGSCFNLMGACCSDQFVEEGTTKGCPFVIHASSDQMVVSIHSTLLQQDERERELNRRIIKKVQKEAKWKTNRYEKMMEDVVSPRAGARRFGFSVPKSLLR